MFSIVNSLQNSLYVIPSGVFFLFFDCLEDMVKKV